ncbi:ABC transporter substrate-binding protein [Pseudoalteromonas sp. SWXJZ94C]|uniref:ABC transporter substrate-binding protein n=1 Tax=Pseudoalteromonas sp. SWXJZ94C TaxID=2792065 RepID=UPI0018CD68F5|nr:ABC transporter substrate-binding protein [Pseudoalteromonas sp. SWXJZ94C]MBH0058162.1 ABC transporter substrate-binding protein [Pseudoalteromonas sp. SWXJZ94C]
MPKNGYFVLSLFITYNVCASEQEKQPLQEIIWLQSHTAPFHIAKSERSPQGGLCDNLTEQLINNIPGVKHTRLAVPQARIHKYLAEGKNICLPCTLYKNHSNQMFKYSNPTAVYPPFSVITTKALKPILTKKYGNPIHLISLLTDQNYIYGQAATRRFSPNINTIINNRVLHINAPLNLKDQSQALTTQLNYGFLDYVIDYPFMINYFKQQNKFNNLVSIPIEENYNTVIQGAVSCAVNAPNNFAEQAINKINFALKNKILQSYEYQHTQYDWLNNGTNNFRQHYSDYVLNFNSHTTAAQASIVR